jgi:dTDP-4-amino-4,6-dideoxygalactose transaminase
LIVKVPFVDLYAQYLSIKNEIDAAIQDVIAGSAFIRGPHVEAFERAWAETVGVRHCVSCANGTDALLIALRALGVRPGDEVITTAHSWISTSAMITQAGGRVVFSDVEPATFTIDPAQIAARITPRTVGIVPVHLYGQPADLDPIMDLARRHGLWVIEDCAQAHLARYKGRLVGTFGNAATYSFYPEREHVYHLYVVRTPRREALRAHLNEAGIATLLNYPKALPFYPAYAHLGHTPAEFPVAHRNQSRILSLPIYPEMPPEMVEHVAHEIRRFLADRSGS